MAMFIKNILKIAKYKSVPIFGNKQQNDTTVLQSDKTGRSSSNIIDL